MKAQGSPNLLRRKIYGCFMDDKRRYLDVLWMIREGKWMFYG